jgi:negative regulator of flagellin synthesis FlgM
MDFTSGIGSLQPTINSTASSEGKSVVQVGVSDSDTKDRGVSTANVVHADQANLSSAAGLVAQALEGSDTRAAKVAALQQAIVTGSYSVSSSDVADKIIQSLLD